MKLTQKSRKKLFEIKTILFNLPTKSQFENVSFEKLGKDIDKDKWLI